MLVLCRYTPRAEVPALPVVACVVNPCWVTESQAHGPVFGLSLETHLTRSNREIAYVLEECICTLLHIGMEEEVGSFPLQLGIAVGGGRSLPIQLGMKVAIDCLHTEGLGHD